MTKQEIEDKITDLKARREDKSISKTRVKILDKMITELEKELELLVEKKELLTKLFIKGFYPYSKVACGDLLKDKGIELIELYRAPYSGLLHHPKWGEHLYFWIRDPNLDMSWGSNTGWNITHDCKNALCRVEYDDYIFFEIKFNN